MKSIFRNTDAVNDLGELRWSAINGHSRLYPTEAQFEELLPYRIDIRPNTSFGYDEAEWIEANCDGVWTKCGARVYFEFEHDALLFKLWFKT